MIFAAMMALSVSGMMLGACNEVSHQSSFDDCVQVTAGCDHSCCLHEDGHVSCWGDNSDGEFPPSDVFDIVQVEAACNFTCTLHEAGNIDCVGVDAFCVGDQEGDECLFPGYTIPPAGNDFIQIDCYSVQCCTLHESHGVTCWGIDHAGSTMPPSDTDFLSLSVGGEHSCGMRENHIGVCWGDDSIGQTVTPSLYGDQVESFGELEEISAGSLHTCVRYANDYYGCVGHSDVDPDVFRHSDSVITQIESGGFFACILFEPGQVECWGDNYSGQLDTPEYEDFVQIAGGGQHACGIRANGRVVCWGDNSAGQSSPP